MPKLLLKFETAVIKEIAITKNVMTVGRKDDNDIVIDNPAVSGSLASPWAPDHSSGSRVP